MRIAQVMGTITLSLKDRNMPTGRLLVCEVLDTHALAWLDNKFGRKSPMPESLIVFDDLGAGAGSRIAVAESGEAAAPFKPDRVPLDAYCAAILDEIVLD